MRLAALFLIALTCAAGVIDGVVVEDESGYALAWSQVTLIPLASGGGVRPVTVRSSNRGTFRMPEVTAGWYVMRASREGFAASEAGQMRPGRPGIPFEIRSDSRSYFQIRMRRMAAISGTLVDQNNVGMPEWPVQVYSSHRPIRKVASGTTDERGVFRIGLLAAGSYVVRSAGGTTEEGASFVPAYYPYGTNADMAATVRVRVGETTPDVNFRAVRGRLFKLSGAALSPVSARLAMITESGRVTITSVAAARGTAFEVQGVPPGPVELVLEGPQCSGYMRLNVDRDLAGLRMICGPLSQPTFEWAAGRRFPIQIRRFDLDQTGPAHLLSEGESMSPGRYEILPETGEQNYVPSVERATVDDGWFLLDLSDSPKVTITVAGPAASIGGTAMSGGMPLAGAMVYLERVDAPQLWTVRAGVDGSYRFSGLAPGRYRLVSSFDFDPDDRRAMNEAPIIDLKEGDRVSQPLESILP